MWKKARTTCAEVRLTGGSSNDTAHPSCDSRNTSRRFAFAWSMKSRDDPSRHGRDARVNGLKATATRGMSTPSPPRRIVNGQMTKASSEGAPPPPGAPHAPLSPFLCLNNDWSVYAARTLAYHVYVSFCYVRYGCRQHSRNAR